jgi:hypothetical protein
MCLDQGMSIVQSQVQSDEIGKLTEKVAPLPTPGEETWIRPPCASIK